jgi:hypothetical protein
MINIDWTQYYEQYQLMLEIIAFQENATPAHMERLAPS